MNESEIKLDMEAKVRTTPEINAAFLPGEVGCVLDWEVRDTKSNELIEAHIKKAESFTRQFFDLLLIKFLGAMSFTQYQIRDITNTLQYVGNSPQIFATPASVGDVSMGIIVGTGNTAPTITNYQIQTIIPHDSGAHGAGTLQYGSVTYGLPASDATTSQFTITRNFANGTVGAITVNEIALYTKALADNPYAFAGAFSTLLPQFIYFMTIRDVIGGGISVGAGQTLTVNYRPQVVV